MKKKKPVLSSNQLAAELERRKQTAIENAVDPRDPATIGSDALVEQVIHSCPTDELTTLDLDFLVTMHSGYFRGRQFDFDSEDEAVALWRAIENATDIIKAWDDPVLSYLYEVTE